MKNKFFTREFVPAAQISQVERMAWLLVWIFLSLRNETGIYAIRYDSITSNVVGSTLPVIATLSLANGGIPIIATTSSATIVATGDNATLSGNTILSVVAPPETITLVAGNTSADFSSTSISIIKLD